MIKLKHWGIFQAVEGIEPGNDETAKNKRKNKIKENKIIIYSQYIYKNKDK